VKRQVVFFNDLGFSVSSGYAPVRVAWNDVKAIWVTADAVVGSIFAVVDRSDQGLELYEDATGLITLKAEIYRRYSVSQADQTRLEHAQVGEQLRLELR
jgi:hypothetical protein